MRAPQFCPILLLLANVAFAQAGNRHDYELVQATGHPEIYLLAHGERHHIEDPSWFGQNGFPPTPIRYLPLSELESIPEGHPLPKGSGMPSKKGATALDGMLIRDGEGKDYVIWHGSRHWILSSKWIENGPYADKGVIQISDAQLEQIPVGANVEYLPRWAKAAFGLFAAALFSFFFYASKIRMNGAARLALAAVFIAAIGFKEPYLLSTPRFWAEEARDSFQYGAAHGILETLFHVVPAQNYFYLAGNAGGILSARTATHFGLLHAPAATTWFSYLIQALAILSILVLKSRLFDAPWKTIAGCLIVLFAPTTTDEIWLNTVNSATFLGLISLVILFVDLDGLGRRVKWAMRAALAFCALSSPYTAAILPLFFVSRWLYREPERRVQCAILTVCVLLQATIVLASIHKISENPRYPMRATTVRADAVAVNTLAEHMLYPSLGLTARERLLEVTHLKAAQFAASTIGKRPFERTLPLAGFVSALAIVGLLFFLRGPTVRSTANLIVAAFLSLSVFVSVTAFHSAPTGRYAFLPGACFLFLVMANLDATRSPAHRAICIAILSTGLAAGMSLYRRTVDQVGPPWPIEVKKWDRDHSYKLCPWPGAETYCVSYRSLAARRNAR